MRAWIIGVMGPGDDASQRDIEAAEALGRMIAARGWITLSGGRDTGVMAAVTRGAAETGGLTVGILPGEDAHQCAPLLHLPIPTGMGNARNNINVLASDLLIAVAFRPGAGTVSEIALALKAGKPLILLGDDPATTAFFQRLAGGNVHLAANVDQAMAIAEQALSDSPGSNHSLWVKSE